MTSPISPLSPVSIEDLRGRVREAESLLGVARGLASDELHDPLRCERARDRIVSILREIDALFPGLNDPPPAIDPTEFVAPSMRERSFRETGLDDERSEASGEASQEEVEDEAKDEEEEWDLDHEKLAAALDNAKLMEKIPEVDRDWFRRMALRSLEARERVLLCERVRLAFDELARAMKAGLDETSRQLSVALTFEQLKARQRH
jgi:hypothetical protein